MGSSFTHNKLTQQPHIQCNIIEMNSILERFLQFIFVSAFIYYQVESIRAFLEGEVVYDLIHKDDEVLEFPAVTLCPYQHNRLLYIKDHSFLLETNLSSEAKKLDNFQFVEALIDGTDFSETIQQYSFSMSESFNVEGWNSHVSVFGFAGPSRYVDIDKYDEEWKKHLENVKGPRFAWLEDEGVPVGVKKVNDGFGQCFYLTLKGNSSLDKKFHGKVVN